MKKVLLDSDVINSVSSVFFRIDSFTFMQIPISDSVRDSLRIAIDSMQEQGYGQLDTYLSLPLKALFETECKRIYGAREGSLQTVETIFPMLDSVTWMVPDYLKNNCKI